MSSIGAIFANQGIQETLHNLKGGLRSGIFSNGCGRNARYDPISGLWELQDDPSRNDLCYLAEGYSQYRNVFRDGTFWTVKLELMVNRDRSTACGRDKQWFQRYDTVRINAVWFRACTWHSLPWDCTYVKYWQPKWELSPTVAERFLQANELRGKSED